jgi:hypothetical protein
LKEKIRESIAPKVKKIDDASSAFDTIGEIETDISPYDFLEKTNDSKKDTKKKTTSIDDLFNDIEESDII